MSADTIFALSSGSPPAAVALIRVSGSAAHSAAFALGGDLPAPRQASLRTLKDSNGAVLDRALLLRFDGPASATGEDLVEFHCHGGRAIVSAVLKALGRLEGLREAGPGEFTRRAFENGRIDLTEAEGLADLLEAETESQRRAALLMAEGGLRRSIEQWRAALLGLSARAEVAIDHVDDDTTGADAGLSRDCGALANDLARFLKAPRAEPLRDGVLVVLAGPPNSGKSSLLNALIGYDRAIVTDVPGTTRDHIEVAVASEGVPLRLTDTAGIRDTADQVERIGVERARNLAEGADILLWLGEPGQAPTHSRLVLVHSKADLPGRSEAPPGSIAVSAMTGLGVPDLTKHLSEQARDLLPAEGQLALNERQARCLADASLALREASEQPDVVLLAESLRTARAAFDTLTGRAGVEDLLDSLFGRFCLGK